MPYEQMRTPRPLFQTGFEPLRVRIQPQPLALRKPSKGRSQRGYVWALLPLVDAGCDHELRPPGQVKRFPQIICTSIPRKTTSGCRVCSCIQNQNTPPETFQVHHVHLPAQKAVGNRLCLIKRAGNPWALSENCSPVADTLSKLMVRGQHTKQSL